MVSEGKNSLSKRLIAYLILFSSAIALVATAIQLYFEYNRDIEQLSSLVTEINTIYQEGLTRAVWTTDMDEARIILTGISELPDIAYAEIVYQDEILAKSEPEDNSAAAFNIDAINNNDGSFITSQIPLIYSHRDKEILVGDLYLYATLDNVYQKFYSRVWIVLITNGTKTALVALFFYLLFSRLVSRHLEKVIKFLDSYSNKMPVSLLLLDRKAPTNMDELDMLVQSINGMYDNLRTLMKSLTDQHEQLENLVTERTVELHEAQEELVRKERLATLGLLTGTVSHELRNPLGAMRSSLYIVQKKSDVDDERVQKALGRVDRNITRCDRIIDEMLDFTRITYIDGRDIEIDKWLKSVIVEQEIPEGMLVKQNYSLQQLKMTIDPDRLRRAVINVVDNACQAMQDQVRNVRKNSCLEIQTIATDGRIEIKISDNGEGIPDSVLAKVYEPLFSTRGFGVGLGMPTVKQIIEQHAGGVEIETEEGKGTTVTLWLLNEPVIDIDEEAVV